MKIYEMNDKEGRLLSFEIENSLISRKRVAKLVSTILGVKVLRKPKKILSWFREDTFCEFEINNIVFEVEEPYGDNSRYWVGEKEPNGYHKEIHLIEKAFKDA